uniref:protein-serine/threonine phosphatase n=1 Tax=Nelumbo nucifera TaxID=4432 RepID=A0A822XK61_NELNU|nr:TPA_asm: hypothetical protein HUJ06_020668 [Nelumbo nucifera]
MSPDSSKRDESLSLSCVKRSLHVRRKRLENRRLKAVSSREDLASLGDGNSADVSKLEDDARVCVAKKTRLANNEVVTVCQSRNDGDTELKTDACSDELPSNHSSLSSASSSSSENEGVPMLVGGGEVFGRGDKLRILPCLSHGSASVCGRRREMEDAVTVVPGFLNEETGLYDFFAVYDGHGGARVAQVCRERLHRLLAKEIEGREASEVATKREEDIKWEEVMLASFAKMDEEINGDEVVVEDGSSSLKTIGSTAVVALVGTEKVVVANCGDSRAVLSRGGVAIPLSRDHKVII